MALDIAFLVVFYDNSILPGTKMIFRCSQPIFQFYDNSILPGTKIWEITLAVLIGFTITQFFQVLKS